jgi:hypothetical protein
MDHIHLHLARTMLQEHKRVAEADRLARAGQRSTRGARRWSRTARTRRLVSRAV